MLLAVNPYKKLQLYTRELITEYHQNDRVAPHIYSTAKDALLSLKRTKKFQSIVITGVSGSGKTVTTNKLLDFLCSGNEKLLEKANSVTTILELFGNCRTPQNKNSSRFVKMIQVTITINALFLRLSSLSLFYLASIQ